jgi:hypothetical protein
MPTFIFGLPVHVLVVHAVVVLMPVAALGTVVIAARPATRPRWGWPVVILTAVATTAVPIATSSGDGLEHNLPRTPAMTTHTHLGDQLLPYAIAMLVFVTGLMLLQRYREQSATKYARHAGPGTMAIAPATEGRVRLGIAALAVLAGTFAVLSTVQVVRIGDTGARAAWGSTQYAPQPRHTSNPGGVG